METRTGRGDDASCDDVLSIVVVGPESSGKSTLARQLADHLDAPLVAEQARAYLDAHPAPSAYDCADLQRIARLQHDAELAARRERPVGGRVVVDTDLLVIRIWAEVRFGRVPAAVRRDLAARPPAVYLLTAPDLPWSADPLREHPDPEARASLHQRYREALDAMGARWEPVQGHGRRRLQAALTALESLRALP